MSLRTSFTLLDRLREPENLEDWNLFVSLYSSFIERQLKDYSIDEHEVEDLKQETIFSIYQSLREFEHNGRKGAFRTWIRKIIHLRALNFLRKQNKTPISASNLGIDKLDDLAIVSFDDDAVWGQEHDNYVLSRLLSIIEPEFTQSTWMAFKLQSLLGLSPQQAAEQLGLTPNAVMIAKSRVLGRLRDLCKGIVDDELL